MKAEKRQSNRIDIHPNDSKREQVEGYTWGGALQERELLYMIYREYSNLQRQEIDKKREVEMIGYKMKQTVKYLMWRFDVSEKEAMTLVCTAGKGSRKVG